MPLTSYIEEVRHAYKSKYNLNCKKQKNGKKLHYLAVKSLPALLRGITSKNNGDFYCLNCFHSFTTENKLKNHYNICKNYDYCYVEMPKEDNKILKYNRGEKSMKVPFIIYAGLESLTVCSYHVTYAFQSESPLYSCLNVKELLARYLKFKWLQRNLNHNYLVCNRTINHLAQLAKWLSVRLRTKWLLLRVPLQSLRVFTWKNEHLS